MESRMYSIGAVCPIISMATKARVARLTPRLLDWEEVAFIVSGPLLFVLVLVFLFFEVLGLVEVVLVTAAST